MIRRSLLATLTVAVLSLVPSARAGCPTKVITNADLPAKPKISVVGTLKVDGPREMPRLDAIDVMNPPAPPQTPEPFAPYGRSYERRGLWGIPGGWAWWYGPGVPGHGNSGHPGHDGRPWRHGQVRPAIDRALPMPMPMWPAAGGYPNNGPRGPVPSEIRGHQIPSHAPGSWPSSTVK